MQNCVSDLEQILEYAKSNYTEINLWTCSMGAYFSLLAFIDYVGSIDLISILNYDNNLVIKICSISLQGNLHNLLFLKNMVE